MVDSDLINLHSPIPLKRALWKGSFQPKGKEPWLPCLNHWLLPTDITCLLLLLPKPPPSTFK